MVHYIHEGVTGYNLNKKCISFSEECFFSEQTVQTLLKCCSIRHFIWVFTVCQSTCFTLDRRQSKMLSTIDKCGSKIARNSVFDFHLSPVGRQMAIKNSVSTNFDLCSSMKLTFSIVAYPVCLGVSFPQRVK